MGRNSVSPLKSAGLNIMGKQSSMSPREFVSYKKEDDGGIDGYYAPVENAPSKTPGFMIPKQKVKGVIMEEALRRAKDPTADTYKSPFEGDWVLQGDKYSKKQDIGKRRRMTMTEELATNNISQGPAAYKLQEPLKPKVVGHAGMAQKSPRRDVAHDEVKRALAIPGVGKHDLVNLQKFKERTNKIAMNTEKSVRTTKIRVETNRDDYYANYAKGA